MAFTLDGNVFVHHRDFDPAKPDLVKYHLLTLDRATSTWQPVQSAPDGYLAAADGDALIFADLAGGLIRLSWYQHP